MRYAVARSAVCAIGKGISVAAIGRVRHVGKAIGARGNVWAYEHSMPGMVAFQGMQDAKGLFVGDDVAFAMG